MAILTFLNLFSIFLIIPLVYSKWNYNCVCMTAEIFPVPKLEVKNWSEGNFTLPKSEEVDRQIKAVENKLLQTMPKDKVEAYDQFEQLRQKLNNAPSTIKRTPDQDFEDKMKLWQIKDFIPQSIMLDSFPFIDNQYPEFWVNEKYRAEYFIKVMIRSEVGKVNKLRYHKSTLSVDYCRSLANSLKNDGYWRVGRATDAYKLVLGCYEMFPFNVNASHVSYDMIGFMSTFYVFANFTTNGVGIPLYTKALKEENMYLQSNFRFHDYLSNLLSSLDDAHCSYKAVCYGQFIFIQPLFLQSYLDNDFIRVFIQSTNQPELEEWVNNQVVFMEGNFADEYMLIQAEEIGMAYDSNNKYSHIMSRRYWNSNLRDFTVERGPYLLRTTAPDRPYVVYGMRKPGSDYVYEIKVNWMVFKADTLKSFSNQYSYWNVHCAAKPFVKKSTLSKRSTSRPTTLHRRGIAPTVHPEDKKTYEGVSIIAIGPEFAFLVLEHQVEGKFAVLVINSFNVVDLQSWFLNMRKGFEYIQNNNYRRLILDLSGNTGGVICLAYSLLAVLSPSLEHDFPATRYPYPTVTAVTEMFQKFSLCAAEANLTQSPLRLQSFLDENRTKIALNATWMDATYSYTRRVGGLAFGGATLSQFLLDECQLKDASVLKDIRINLESIIVLTDGFCGSTCAILAANLQESGNPAIVYLSRPFEHSNAYSFAGGQVITMDNVKDVAKRSSCYDDVPQMLEQASMTTTYRGIFSLSHPEVPLEFSILPAHSSIYHSLLSLGSMKERWTRTLEVGLDVKRNPELYFVNRTGSNQVGGLNF